MTAKRCFSGNPAPMPIAPMNGGSDKLSLHRGKGGGKSNCRRSHDMAQSTIEAKYQIRRAPSARTIRQPLIEAT